MNEILEKIRSLLKKKKEALISGNDKEAIRLQKEIDNLRDGDKKD